MSDITGFARARRLAAERARLAAETPDEAETKVETPDEAETKVETPDEAETFSPVRSKR